MKKTVCFLSLVAIFGGISKAQCFQKGDIVTDVGVGVGIADIVKVSDSGLLMTVEEGSTPTFTQKIAFEYGVVQFGKSTIGIGAIISNAYGFGYESVATGQYNYTYDIKHYRNNNNHWTWYHTTEQRREGTVTVNSKNHLDDLSAMLKGSYHVELSKGLDTYATLGFGVSFYNYCISPDEEPNLASGSSSLDRYSSSTIQFVYNYNDADHVKWVDGSNHARLALALCIGARYYITSNWGIYGEFGLTSASFKKNCNVYNLLSIGASYKF